MCVAGSKTSWQSWCYLPLFSLSWVNDRSKVRLSIDWNSLISLVVIQLAETLCSSFLYQLGEGSIDLISRATGMQAMKGNGYKNGVWYPSTNSSCRNHLKCWIIIYTFTIFTVYGISCKRSYVCPALSSAFDQRPLVIPVNWQVYSLFPPQTVDLSSFSNSCIHPDHRNTRGTTYKCHWWIFGILFLWGTVFLFSLRFTRVQQHIYLCKDVKN